MSEGSESSGRKKNSTIRMPSSFYVLSMKTSQVFSFFLKMPLGPLSHHSPEDKRIADLTGLSQTIVIALAFIVKYLSAFGLSNALLEMKFFEKFAARTQMLLDAKTIRNL